MALTKAETVKNAQMKCDAIMLRPKKEKGLAIRKAAENAGESVSGYILKAVYKRMESENQAMPD